MRRTVLTLMQATGALVALLWALPAFAQQTNVALHGKAFGSADAGVGTWYCSQVNFPAGSTERNIYMNPAAGATGDPDLYIYDAPGTTQLCKSENVGHTEHCYNGPGGASAETVWACVSAYSTYVGAQLFSGYIAPGAAAAAASTTATAEPYYVTYWKDNLFLGIAYHRGGCLTNGSSAGKKVKADQDYDGFSDGDYCRKDAAWDSPWTTYGASSHVRTDALNTTSLSAAKAILDNQGTATNTRYSTANYARRAPGSSCSYNILTKCNSDCWIRHFSYNVRKTVTGTGLAIDIASSCSGDPPL